MATEIEHSSILELHNDKKSTSASIPATSGPKVSMFAAKSGFVIPKNKLSGSLVPIFRGSKKLASTDAASQENNNDNQRKTKWGPDLTQDASVKKGRVLAYQTRVDQIAQQLRQGIIDLADHKDSEVSDEHADLKASRKQNEVKVLETLERERQELIGEILKLNPSYKAPPDYKPSLKEAAVVIPVKDHPEYNFVGLICGPGNETLKRLEKETGAKLQLHGIKSGSTEKVEISTSGANETHTTYIELTVLVSAHTFDKVDSAVSVIELLISSISGNLAAGAIGDEQTPETPVSAAPDVGNRETAQLADVEASQGEFPSWFTGAPPPGPAHPSSSFISPQNLSALMPNHRGDAPLPFFSSSTRTPHLGPPSSSMFTSIPVQPHPSRYPSPNPYPPRSFSMQVTQPPFQMQMNSSAPPPFQRPQSGFHTTTMPSQPQLRGENALSSAWSGTSAGPTAPSMVPSQGQVIPQPGYASGPNLGFPGNVQPRQQYLQLPSGQMSHPTPGSIPGQLPQSFALPRPNFPAAHFSSSLMKPAATQQPMTVAVGRPNEHSGMMPGMGPNFFPLRQPSLASGPQHPVRGDFTFQPDPPNPHNLQPGQSTMNTYSNRPMFSPAAPAPSFQLMQSNSNLHPGPHEFPGHQMGQPRLDFPFAGNPTGLSVQPRFAAFPDGRPFPGRTPVPQMISRNMGPMRPSNHLQLQPGFQSEMMPPNQVDLNQQQRPNISFGSFRPGANPGRQQVYDPFSPSASQQPGIGRKADNDPEYEDLMASMGVK